MSQPTNYCIHGPESLLEAAHKEMKSIKTIKITDKRPEYAVKRLLLNANNDLLVSTLDGPHNSYADLTLPADWDKLMGILAELSKPKLPEYAQRVGVNRAFKVLDYSNTSGNYRGLDVYGNPYFISPTLCTPITEAEFIEGGLKELAEAGFVKGAVYTHQDNEYKREIGEVKYHALGMGVNSGVVIDEVAKAGFCFHLATGATYCPVGQCTLVAALCTTENGMPYLRIKNEDKVYVGIEPPFTLRLNEIGRWKNLGVTSITLPCGTLTAQDLITLTK